MKLNLPFWEKLAPLSDDRLYAARAQMHQAVQLLAACGISFLEAKADDSHTAMTWSVDTHCFLSRPFGGDSELMVSLNPETMELTLIKDKIMVQHFDLNRSGLGKVTAQLEAFLVEQGLPKETFTMEKHYELPSYPERVETPFDTSDTEAFKLLASSYHNAFILFENMALTEPNASDLLIWPHHFDLGFLLSTDTTGPGNLGQSIGVGLSPGDDSYPAPYYYVTNWPAPDKTLDDLKSRGSWHTLGWTGMVLPLEPIVAEPDLKLQQKIVTSFLTEALSIAKTFSR